MNEQRLKIPKKTAGGYDVIGSGQCDVMSQADILNSEPGTGDVTHAGRNLGLHYHHDRILKRFRLISITANKL